MTAETQAEAATESERRRARPAPVRAGREIEAYTREFASHAIAVSRDASISRRSSG